MRTSISLTLLSVLIVVSLQPSEAMAHAKTDVITVDNGDQLTGAIDSMTAGKLALNTDYAGTIQIKWRDVHHIDSRYLYEVRLEDGERIYGRFSPSEIAGDLIFYSGGRQRTLLSGRGRNPFNRGAIGRPAGPKPKHYLFRRPQ
jgi:hypothetical protein